MARQVVYLSLHSLDVAKAQSEGRYSGFSVQLITH